MWKWNEAEWSTVRIVEMSYLRAVSGVTLMDRVRNEEVYERFEIPER